MSDWLIKAFVRAALAIPAALFTVELLALTNIEPRSEIWVGLIAAVAVLAASFADDVFRLIRSERNQVK